VVFLVIVLGMFLDIQEIPHRQDMSKNMPSTITRNNTPSEHVQKHAEYNNKKYHTVRTCPKTTCSDGGVFLVIVLGMFLDMF
jgi:hypothetical protein